MKAYFHKWHAGDPHYNMAYDEWLLERVGAHPKEIHLRLYSWAEGAITIGINQELERAVDSDLVGATPVIRRVTGGRALYHDLSELTYSFACNLDGGTVGIAASRSTLYRSISSALVRFLEAVGVEAAYVKRSSRDFTGRDSFHKAPCFTSTARYEVTGEAGKIVASAACWRGKSLMQHGSIKIGGIAPHPALPVAGSAARAFSAGVPETLSFAALTDSFERAFAEEFGLRFTSMDLADDFAAQILQASKTIRKNPTSTRLYF
ncbi:MAG: hypothetical protein ABIE70_11430 [bacterium]